MRPAHVRRMRFRATTRLGLVVDVVIAVGLTALVQVAVWLSEGLDETFVDKPLSSVVLGLTSLSLVARRRVPLAVASAVAGGILVQSWLTGTFAQAPALALVIAVALYSLGAHTTGRRAVVGTAMIALAIQLKSILTPPSGTDEGPFVALFWWLLCLSLTGLGALVRNLRESAELRRVTLEREAEREARAASAVAEERQRIARELHDVVAHNVSASIVQAGAAEELLHSDPDRAGDALRSIQELGREAIVEMRTLLGMLRSDDRTIAPQPTLSELPDLVEQSIELGLATELRMVELLPDLGPGLEVTVYRVVQEALTNVRRHACAQRAWVNLRYQQPWLEVEIFDDGRGASEGGTGHGLRGMRERVEIFGGTLDVGSAGPSGFRVVARLPVGGSG